LFLGFARKITNERARERERERERVCKGEREKIKGREREDEVKQRFDVVFCVWRALRSRIWVHMGPDARFSGPNCRVALFNYRVWGPPRI
jgi:hypothetical protein